MSVREAGLPREREVVYFLWGVRKSVVLRLEFKFDQGTTREGNSVFKVNPSRAHQCRLGIICSSFSKAAAEGIGIFGSRGPQLGLMIR